MTRFDDRASGLAVGHGRGRADHGLATGALLLLGGALALGAAACADEGPGVTVAPLTAVCVEPDAGVTVDWACGEPLVVECRAPATPVAFIYVDADQVPDGVCGAELLVSDPGPFALGDHGISVRVATDLSVEVCASTLTVVDTTPPLVTTHAVELWPPNHKLHTVVPADCVDVVDACDPDVVVTFTDAVSDEPVNDVGDGNSDPDIVDLGPDSVSLRAERSGTGDGRVYTLGWRAVDASGNATVGTCDVIVPHDQGD
ncbi:MAG: hypothetical protein U1F43_17875 [Myxococcota bacterium]